VICCNGVVCVDKWQVGTGDTWVGLGARVLEGGSARFRLPPPERLTVSIFEKKTRENYIDLCIIHSYLPQVTSIWAPRETDQWEALQLPRLNVSMYGRGL
jgi:hypothetical protein